MMQFHTLLKGVVLVTTMYFPGSYGQCINRKYESVEGHTACLDTDSSNIIEKGLSDEDRRMILDLHNQYRAEEPAANMQKMVWDDEIEKIAEKWADNCEFEHDRGRQRSIPGRFSVGQNLALGHRSWERAITAWYDEVEFFTYNSSRNSFSAIGHFTQLAWATTSKLGCAYTRCSNLAAGFSNGRFYVCNYGPAGNIGNVNTPYKRFRRSKCEDCPGHCDEELQLCDCGGKACENGGTLDLTTCICSCDKEFHVGEECGLDCSAAMDGRGCGTRFRPSDCDRFSNIPYDCPNMCGVCPFGGIEFRNQEGPVTTTRRPATTRQPNTTQTTTRRPATQTPGTTTKRPRVTTTQPRTTATTQTTTTTERETTRRPNTRIPTPSETTTTRTATSATNESPCLARKFERFVGHTACMVPDVTQILEKGVSLQERKKIVDLHNQCRAAQPATNMQKMIWDDELADIAEKWADNCNYNHDRESMRAIPGRFAVGQNLALGHRSWESVINAWYNEVQLFKYNGRNRFRDIRHYTQLVWAETNKIGCAYTKCSNLSNRFYNGKFYVCNYGPAGNAGNYNRPYKRKLRSRCQDCPGHCDEKLQLCDCGGKTCENGGAMDLATCTCSCKRDFHIGEECKLDCSKARDVRWCGRQWPRFYCGRYSDVVSKCPNMCGVCPYAGINYLESTTEQAVGPNKNTTPAQGGNTIDDSDEDSFSSTTLTTSTTTTSDSVSTDEPDGQTSVTPTSDLVRRLLLCLFSNVCVAI